MKILLNSPALIPSLFIIFLISACSSENYVSTWNAGTIVIDGKQSDWEGKLNYFEDERAAVGAFNDNENLYLCLTTDDRGKIMQLLNLGLTLWLESDNDNVRTRGIKYPLQSEDFNRESTREVRGKVAQDNYIEKLLVDFQRKQPELQIVNEDNYSLYMYPVNNGSGIKIGLAMSMQQFVYEISIPLGDNKSEFNLALSPGDKLTVAFKTNEFQKSEGNRGSGMTGGGRSGGGRSGEGGHKGSHGAGIYGRPEPIDVKFNVKLAESP